MMDREPGRRGAPLAEPGRGAPTRAPAVGEPLPLDARVERGVGGGWRVTLPLRAERVRADRQTVVRAEVVLRPSTVSGVEPAEGTVARGERRVDVQGDIEATQLIADR